MNSGLNNCPIFQVKPTPVHYLWEVGKLTSYIAASEEITDLLQKFLRVRRFPDRHPESYWNPTAYQIAEELNAERSGGIPFPNVLRWHTDRGWTHSLMDYSSNRKYLRQVYMFTCLRSLSNDRKLGTIFKDSITKEEYQIYPNTLYISRTDVVHKAPVLTEEEYNSRYLFRVHLTAEFNPILKLLDSIKPKKGRDFRDEKN